MEKGGVTKIAAEKIENVGTALKKCLKCGQAAQPSRSTDLSGRAFKEKYQPIG